MRYSIGSLGIQRAKEEMNLSKCLEVMKIRKNTLRMMFNLFRLGTLITLKLRERSNNKVIMDGYKIYETAFFQRKQT